MTQQIFLINPDTLIHANYGQSMLRGMSEMIQSSP